MPEVTLGKATYYPLNSRNVHPSGTVLSVTADEERLLRGRGVLTEVVEVPVRVAPVAEEPAPKGGFPALPSKTAPVGEWKEYARLNGIKLTGLTKRNEIMGFVTKTVNGSR